MSGIGYLLTGRAAKKLIDEKPLEKMVRVDYFFAAMYDKHFDDIKAHFRNGTVKAFTANPGPDLNLLLVHII